MNYFCMQLFLKAGLLRCFHLLINLFRGIPLECLPLSIAIFRGGHLRGGRLTIYRGDLLAPERPMDRIQSDGTERPIRNASHSHRIIAALPRLPRPTTHTLVAPSPNPLLSLRVDESRSQDEDEHALSVGP